MDDFREREPAACLAHASCGDALVHQEPQAVLDDSRADGVDARRLVVGAFGDSHEGMSRRGLDARSGVRLPHRGCRGTRLLRSKQVPFVGRA